MSAWLEWLGIVHLGLFLSAVLLLNLTPGPDTYLVVLGVRLCWRSSKPDAGRPDAPVALKRAPKPQRAGHSLLVQGFLTNLFTPKVILFFVAFFPQFVTQASASKPLALLVLGAMFFFMSLLYNCSVAWLAGSITTRVRAVPGVALWLERMVGVAFVALGARLALIERPL